MVAILLCLIVSLQVVSMAQRAYQQRELVRLINDFATMIGEAIEEIEENETK